MGGAVSVLQVSLLTLSAVVAGASGLGAGLGSRAAASEELLTCTLDCSASTTTFADAGETLYFWGSATPSGCAGPPLFDWDFGDGSAHSSLEDPTHAYTSGGTITWTLTVAVGDIRCTRTGTISVCGLECEAVVPAASRAGAPVPFSATADATGCLSFNRYDWDFGDGSAHATWSSPSHAYASPGTYTWTLTVENFTQSCTRSGTITIAEAVACNDCEVTVPATGEVGVRVQVTSRTLPADCSAAVSYGFDFGDGFVAYWGTGWHSYCQPGSYDWAATVTIDGTPCVRTGTIVIAPPATLECSANFTSNGACPLEASYWGGAGDCGTVASYQWDFGDGTGATTEDGKHVYASQGTYPWSMTATLLGVACTVNGSVTVNAPAAITASAAAAPRWGAPPLLVAFHGGAGPESCITAATWHWDFGDGASADERDPSHLYTAPGLYTWTLTVAAEGRTATRRGPVVVGTDTPPVTWAPQLSRRTDIIVDTDFPTELVGWTAGKDGIRSTGDGGRAWSNSLDTSCYAVHFLDASTGFYTAYCGFAWTTNGGATWNEGYWYSDCYGFSFTDLFAASTTQVWQSDSMGDLWRWTYTPGSGYYGEDWTRDMFSSTGASHLQAIYFADPDNGWGVGNGGRIIRIANAASASPGFSTQASGTAANLRNIVMLSPSQGWVVGDNGTILFTVDGGTTWNPRASGTTLNLRGLDFRDAANGWIVGEGGLVLATADGGATWVPEATPSELDLRAVSAPQGERVFAAGSAGELLKRLPFACPPIDIAPETLPPASTGATYSQQILPTGGTAPYTLGLIAGALPEWLQLSPAGVLSGNLRYPGSASFAARAVDANFCSGDRSYDLTVACELTCGASGLQDTAAGPRTAKFNSWASDSCGPASYLWTFGDGVTSTEADPTHTYASAGTYSWTLTVTAGDETCSDSGEVYIRPTCEVTCSAIVPAEAHPWSSVPFQGAAAATPQCWGDIAYDWDFGDASLHGSAAAPVHAYAAPGTYSWTFTAAAGSKTCTQGGTIDVRYGAHRRIRRSSPPGP